MSCRFQLAVSSPGGPVPVVRSARRSVGPVALERRREFPVEQDKRHDAGAVGPVDPCVPGAALHDNIAWCEFDLRLVEDKMDPALENDAEIHGFGAMHH